MSNLSAISFRRSGNSSSFWGGECRAPNQVVAIPSLLGSYVILNPDSNPLNLVIFHESPNFGVTLEPSNQKRISRFIGGI